MITQDQANAIAEREYPEPDMVNEDFPTRFRVKLSVSIERKAYAKALMDMNPLIEAGERMKDEAERLIDAYDLKNTHLRIMINEWDTALSKLNKNIEP
jgi:hypothetical protein